MSHIREPLTLPAHPKLLAEVNEMIIAIKLHHIHPEERTTNAEGWNKAKSNYKEPTWEEVADLLRKAHGAINEQRQDPRKY